MKRKICFLLVVSSIWAADAEFDERMRALIEEHDSYRPPSFQPASFQNRGTAYAEGEFLLWKFANLGLPYGVKENINIGGLDALPYNVKVLNVSFHYEPGFRIHVGYSLPYEEWSLNIGWTLLEASKKGFSEAIRDPVAVVPERLFPFWNYSAYSNYIVNSISSKMQIDFNAVDFEIGKFFFIKKTLAIRPLFGFKASWIDQKEKIDLGLTRTSNPFDVPGLSTAVLTNDFAGAGLRSGTELRMVLKQGWELFAKLFGGFLYGEFTSTHRDHLEQIDVVPDTVFVVDNRSKNHFHLFVPFLETSMGLKWGSYFFGDMAYLDLRIGYEGQVYFDYNQMFYLPLNLQSQNHTAPEQITNGNLGMQGLIAGANLFF